jgi:hypothetical protein
MSASVQTIFVFAIVVLAATFLLRLWFGKKKSAGCGNEGCSAVSPEIKKLRSKLKG